MVPTYSYKQTVKILWLFKTLSMVTSVTSVIYEVSVGTIAAVLISGALQTELLTKKHWDENTISHIGNTTTTRVTNQHVLAM